METIELEKTYLIKYLPKDLEKYPHKELLDIYLPKDDPHPMLRLRKNGEKYEITLKEHISDDMSEMKEHTIHLTASQFYALAIVEGKRVHKIRYLYPYNSNGNHYTVEIDVFLDDLQGLAVADIEFSDPQDKAKFIMPEFCLVNVDNHDFIAGGMLAGKKYGDIEKELEKFGYESKIFLRRKTVSS